MNFANNCWQHLMPSFQAQCEIKLDCFTFIRKQSGRKAARRLCAAPAEAVRSTNGRERIDTRVIPSNDGAL